MSVHKLTAGDGYSYLTRQVAAHDATDRGHQGLADYYAEKGESPGRWFGRGIAALELEPGSQVTESHMRNLFGEGRHPEAERVEGAAQDAGLSLEESKKASQLGRVFVRHLGNQPEFIRETARRYVAYNLARGAHWRTPVPAEERSSIRTDLANEYFLREHGRPPLDDRERGSFMAKATRQQTTAVAGYDLTFAPVKSVSTLWALADPDVARQVEAAHHAAVEATMTWLEREVLFTRRGRGGLQQVRTRGLVAAMFTHRDARSSDPHLHTHVALSNKVQDRSGRWLAVDGRVLFKANVTLAETYNTLIETELVARLGVQFENRSRTSAARSIRNGNKRAVREIVGVDERLASAWSKRHRDIEARRRDLAATFQAEHGRPPTDGEAVTLAEKAWDQTRQAKHAPRAEADQRATWLAEAIEIIGSRDAVRAMVEDCVGRTHEVHAITDEWVSSVAERVVTRVAEDRATWQIWHLRAEAQRQARLAGVRRCDLDAAVERVVSAALSEHSISLGHTDPLTHASTAAAYGVAIPEPLQRVERVGGHDEVVSAYSLAGSRQYSSPEVLDAERRIIAAARRTGGRKVSNVRIGIALASTTGSVSMNDDGPGVALNSAQQSLVRAMATSGRMVQLALAPAGTGKTTAMRVLTRAWQDSGGTVIGLAPSAVAAHELEEAINPATRGATARNKKPSSGRRARTDTLSKLVWHAQNGSAPAWMQRIDTKTLVLIDEAGMAATMELATAIDYLTSRGAQVRLIGDDRQLASVAAGGVLRDIAHQVGAVTLSEVHRFRNSDGSVNHAEAAATLALRDGDPSAIAFYTDRGRVHVGDLGACADQAYAAWAADRASDSILIAPTRELVAELNTRARADRLRGLAEHEVGRVLALADGNHVSAGDPIITRENDRRLRIGRTNWVKNGDRWHVVRVHADGSLRVRHDQLGTTITLPADYATRMAQLGYATTVHGAQGLTTGTCHVVLTGDEDRNTLYVALSRGQYANHLYLNVASDGDPHNLIKPEALIPPTAVDRIAAILHRDGSPVSAATTLDTQTDPHQLLADAAARYHDAVTTGAELLLGEREMDKLTAHAETLVNGLTEAAAWPTLRSHLALTAVDGRDPRHVLTQAVALGPLADAHDVAAVLDARIDDLLPLRPARGRAAEGDALTASPSKPHQSTQGGPLPWLPGIPTRLAATPDWGPFAAAYQRLVREHMDAVIAEARDWTSATAPAWAQPFLDDVHTDLLSDLAVWRAVTRTEDSDLRPTGERTIGYPGAYQAALNRAVRAARPSYPFRQRSWYQSLPDAVLADPWVTPLCQRLARLERAGLPVTRYLREALAADPCSASSSTAGRTPPGPVASSRPLPDEQPAAALWWRLVPHLGPAALNADQHSADLLQPAWRTVLVDIVGAARTDVLEQAPAWPALVAAVDEAFEHLGWSPRQTLTSALSGFPSDGSLAGAEVADALVLRIAMLTDESHEPYEPDEPTLVSDAIWLADEGLRTTPDTAPVVAAGHAEPWPYGRGRSASKPTSHADREHEICHRRDPLAVPLPCELTSEITAEDAFPDRDEVPAGRLYEANQRALDYFESVYSASWAPGYLSSRLGTDLTDEPCHAVGYAPGSGQSLIRRLTGQGFSLDELIQAGLVSCRDRADGTTYYRDFFRDRLVMPIRNIDGRDAGAIVGFVGRRNPSKTDADFVGPKYLNTRTTAIFTKGAVLFGYAEGSELLASGGLPVIVEGPLDALAVTLGSEGTAVGLSPLGTALTVGQVSLLRGCVDRVNGRNHVAIATDSDPAGWESARRAFWRLTAADLDPAFIEIPDGWDPARLLEVRGAQAIASILRQRTALGDVMIDRLMRAPSRGAGAGPDLILRRVIPILGARGAEHWATGFERLNRHLALMPGTVERLTVTESITRDLDPLAYAQARIDEISAEARTRTASAGATTEPGSIERPKLARALPNVPRHSP